MANTQKSILPEEHDDDAVGSFNTMLAKSRFDANQKWLNNMIKQAEEEEPVPKTDAETEGEKPAPEARAKPEEKDGEEEKLPTLVEDLQSLVGFAKQPVGGAIDALGEVGDLMESLLPAGGFQITDPKTGEVDFKFLNPEEFEERGKQAEDDLFAAISPARQDNAISGFVRSTAQFLTGFIPAAKALKGASLMKGAFVTEMTAGAIADAVVFDPYEDRLSTYLNEVPVLKEIVPDYLADTNPANQSEWEGRLKNTIEGAGLGLVAEQVFRAIKYYKARRMENGGEIPEPQTAAEQAARDQLTDNARGDIIDSVSSEQMAALGNPDVDDLMLQAGDDPTLSAALERLGAKRAEVEKQGIVETSLAAISDIQKRFKVDQPGASPLDDALDHLRKGKQGNEAVIKALPKRPALDRIKAMGGVEPGSVFANELKRSGITAKRFPGLFKKGGVERLDNVPRDELDGMFGFINPEDVDVGNERLFVSEDEWIEALDAEAGGQPFRTADELAEIEAADVVGDLEQELDRLGIDHEHMTNDEVAAAIKRVEDEAALFARTADEIPAGDVSGIRLRDADGVVQDEAAENGLLAIYVTDGDKVIANLDVKDAGDAIIIDNIFTSDGIGKGAFNELGIRKIMQIGRELAERFPDAKTVKGVRVGGARFDGKHVGDIELGKAAEMPLARFRKQIASAEARSKADLEIEAAEIARYDEALNAGAPLPPDPKGKIFINHARIKAPDDVKNLIQTLADQEAEAINIKRSGEKVTNADTIKASQKEYDDLTDLIGREPGPMTGAQAVAARRILAASGDQVYGLAQVAALDTASKADLFNFRKAMITHYAIQAEVIAARTETARALQSWSIYTGSSKKARNLVCAI